MSVQCVTALCESLGHAKAAIQSLEAADFPSEQVSLVSRSVDIEEALNASSLDDAADTERNAYEGATVGGVLGALFTAPLVMVTGVGPLLIVGPILMGAAGVVVGGFLGALSNWGVTEEHIRNYEKRVAEGALLVVANGSLEELSVAANALRNTAIDEVHVHTSVNDDDA